MSRIGTKRWMVAVGFAAVAGLGLTASAEAQPPGKPPACNNPRAIARYLKLTEAQVAQVKTLRDTLKATVDPLRAQIEPLHDQLQTLLDGANPDECTVGGVVVDIDALRDDIADAVDAFEDDFAALLTPEQLTKWNALQVVCRARDEVTGG